MVQQIIVRLINVNEGKTENWLKFEAYVGFLDRNRKYVLDFCGTDLEHGLSLPDSEIKKLKTMLCDDFGYAPFDVKKAGQILGNGKSYVLIRGSSNK